MEVGREGKEGKGREKKNIIQQLWVAAMARRGQATLSGSPIRISKMQLVR